MQAFEIEQIRKLIGTRVQYDGQDYLIVEVINAGPELVMMPFQSAEKSIQNDALGYAHRRSHEALSIPIYNRDRTAYSSAFILLDLLPRLTDNPDQ